MVVFWCLRECTEILHGMRLTGTSLVSLPDLGLGKPQNLVRGPLILKPPPPHLRWPLPGGLDALGIP